MLIKYIKLHKTQYNYIKLNLKFLYLYFVFEYNNIVIYSVLFYILYI